MIFFSNRENNLLMLCITKYTEEERRPQDGVAFSPLLQNGERSDNGIRSIVVARTEVCLKQKLQ